MLTKKAGPPVPPRPTASQMAHVLAKSRSCSPIVTKSTSNVGTPSRTLIYKSPSLDENSHQNNSKMSVNGNDLSNKNNKKQVIERQGNVSNNVASHEKQKLSTGTVADVARIPVPKPRQIPSPSIIQNQGSSDHNKKQQITNCDVNYEQTSASTTAVDNRISIQKASVEVKNNRKNVDLFKIGLNTFNHAINNNGDSCIADKDHEENHSTEIVITAKDETALMGEENGTSAATKLLEKEADSQVIEFTNQFMNEIFEKMQKNKKELPNRPEPEGKEERPSQHSLESRKPLQREKTFDEIIYEKKSIFSEMLISEISEKRINSNNSGSPILQTPPQSHSTPKSDASQSPISPQKQQQQKRERQISTSSNDISPQGTHRPPRIRTSDWIEVGDNGKEVVMTSCHISLEDSGLEDEEKLDDASSGVGDSWDSVKDAEERWVLFYDL